MCTTIWAQQADNAAFFAGKWNVTVTATPMGDVTLLMNLKMKEGKLTGNISDPATGNEVAEIYSIEVRENSITVSFNAEGYDVFLSLDKKDENNLTGNMMDMFDATGERVVEKAEK
jgi:hypothetical protein